jgi:hypothetical protein
VSGAAVNDLQERVSAFQHKTKKFLESALRSKQTHYHKHFFIYTSCLGRSWCFFNCFQSVGLFSHKSPFHSLHIYLFFPNTFTVYITFLASEKLYPIYFPSQQNNLLPSTMHFSTQSLYLSVLTLSSSTAVLAAVEPYGRCGGQGHVGETACASGWECKVSNPYYSQCIQGTGSAPAPEAPPAAAQPSAAAPPAENNDTAPAPVAEATTLMTKTKSSATSIVVAPSATAIAAAAPVAKAGANGADCSINAKFIAKGKKYIGVAADSGTLGDATNKQVIIDNFGQVTPENRYVFLSLSPSSKISSPSSPLLLYPLFPDRMLTRYDI